MKVAAIVLGVVLVAGSAIAGPPPGGRPGPGGPGADRIAEALKLNDAQKASWKELHEAQAAQMKASFEEGRRLHEAVRAALDVESPDALRVGRAMIAVDKHRRQMEAARNELEQKLTGLLDEDQKSRFEVLKSMRGPGPGGPGFFGPPPPFRPGDGERR